MNIASDMNIHVTCTHVHGLFIISQLNILKIHKIIHLEHLKNGYWGHLEKLRLDLNR